MIGFAGKILVLLSIGVLVKSLEVDEVHRRSRRQACADNNDNCPDWKKSGFCDDDRYTDYMTKNCKKSCDLCACMDFHEHCGAWASYGFCTDDTYKDYMRDKCPKSCNLCGGPVPPTQPPVTAAPTGSPQGSILDGCSFNSHTCDWLNVPFDDDSDFTVTSGSSGGSGPSSGAGGSGGYAYSYGSGKSQLLLPMELLLDPGSNRGSICMTFNYHMAGGGSLVLKEVMNSRGSPSNTLKTISGNQGNQWQTAQLNINAAADRQLMFEARPGSVIAIDEIRFGDRRC